MKRRTLLSDDEFKLLQVAKKERKQEEDRLSLRKTQNLIEDIDKPLHGVVGMLNLLGFQTIWSCCGFDYEGQPKHKCHEYGNVYIRSWLTPTNLPTLYELLPAVGREWGVTLLNMGDHAELQFKREFGKMHNVPEWNTPSSVHFHEGATTAIHNLAFALWRLNNKFAEEVTLVDMNAVYKQSNPEWAYTPKQPWVIKKSNFVAAPVPVIK